MKTSTISAKSDWISTKRSKSDAQEPIKVPNAVNAGQQLNTMSQNATHPVNNDTLVAFKPIATDDETRVNISKHSINTILIGTTFEPVNWIFQFSTRINFLKHFASAIIIMAVIGLLIGVVCRIDCCGIKTNMCRSQRRPSTEQVRPAEEVPLNKV